MAKAQITHEQFTLEQHKVIHNPTGAWFSTIPGRGIIREEHMGTCGRTLRDGYEYYPLEVRSFAAKLLRNRLARAKGSLGSLG